MTAASDLLGSAEVNPDFLESTITGDEFWVNGYHPETKAQSSAWQTPASARPKKVRQVRSLIKAWIIMSTLQRIKLLSKSISSSSSRFRHAVRRKRQKWDASAHVLQHSWPSTSVWNQEESAEKEIHAFFVCSLCLNRCSFSLDTF